MDARIYSLREQAKRAGNPILRDKSFEVLLNTVKEKSPQKILEIGVNVGLTGISMLLECPNSHLTGIEIDETVAAAARSNYLKFNVEDRAKIFLGDAAEIIPMLSYGYDFIFLDGPKGHYRRYLDDLLRVLKKGGILFADNVLFRGYVGGKIKTPHRYMTTKNSMESFIEKITTDKNLKTQILDIEDGLSITEKLND